MTQNLLIAASCFLVQALLVPALAMAAGREYGRRGMDIAVLVASIVGAVVSIVIAVNFNLSNPFLWALASAVVNTLIASKIGTAILEQIRLEITMAPRVPEVGLRIFNRIDKSGTGIIRADQIYSFLRTNETDEEVKTVLTFIADNIANIGHVVDVVPSTHISAVPVCIYAASRRDLESYPARLRSA